MDIETLMMEALGGTISPADRPRLEAYFAANPDERAVFKGMMDVDTEMRAMPCAEVPHNFSQNVMAVVQTTRIARPFKGRHLAFIVTANSVLIATAWTVGIVLVVGLLGLLIPVEAIHPVAVVVRSVFTYVSDIYSVLAAFSRALIAQPIVWVVGAFAGGIVVLWLGVMVNVFRPPLAR